MGAVAMHRTISKFRIEQSFELSNTIAASGLTFQWGVERITLIPLDGGDATTVVQRSMLLFRRGDDGRWRYARGMTNTTS
jgi:ketosteroid isomerase-like protein